MLVSISGEGQMVEFKDKSHPASPAKPLIFLVDDEPVLLELGSALLEPLGFRVETFRDPETACRAFADAIPRPALVVTDYAMHTMTGIELIAECRRLVPTQKIILLSGTVDERVYRDAPAKPDRFLPKPYGAREFTELVKSILAS